MTAPKVSDYARDVLDQRRNGETPPGHTGPMEPAPDSVSAPFSAWSEKEHPGSPGFSALSALSALPADDGRAELLAGLRDGTWLDAQHFPPLSYAVPGIVPEGLSLMVGPPKVGKSWLVLHMALCVATGGHALRQVSVGPARPVLYLALEDGDRRMQNRCHALTHGESLPERFHYLTHTEPGRVADTVRAWLAIYGEYAPLVILDTLGKAMPPAAMGESSYQRDYRIGGHFKAAIDQYPGASLLIVHHDRKAATDDFVESVSGTNGLAGSADTIIVLTRKRNETDATLKVTGRDVHESDYAITKRAGGTWELDGDDLTSAATTAQTRKATDNRGDRSAEAMTLVTEHPGIGPTRLGSLMGIDANRAGELLTRLADDGHLYRPKRGQYRVPGDRAETAESAETAGHSAQLFPHDAETSAEKPPCLMCGEPMTLTDTNGYHPTCDPDTT